MKIYLILASKQLVYSVPNNSSSSWFILFRIWSNCILFTAVLILFLLFFFHSSFFIHNRDIKVETWWFPKSLPLSYKLHL